MKHYYIIAMMLALASCQKVDLSEEQQIKEQTTKTKQVQFVMAGITEEYSTRATVQSVGMTDIWVFEGKTLLAHQQSTDADFGLPSVTLTYGSHDLTFVASKADGQTFDSLWVCSKVKDTFAKVMNVTVSGSSSNSRQVELKRRSSQVCFDIQDNVPTTVTQMHITAQSHCSLDASLVGGCDTLYNATVNVTSYQGSTFKPTINLLTASATDEEDCSLMVEFLNASGTALYHYERTVKLKPNRCTTLKGSYFSGGSNEITVDTSWLTDLEVPLFSE